MKTILRGAFQLALPLALLPLAGGAAPAALGKDTLEFTIQSTQSVGSKYQGDPFTITISFTCCEQAEDCVPITVTLPVNTNDTPADMATRLAGLLTEACAKADCDVTVQATGGRSVQIYGIPHQANPDCTDDSPCKAPPGAKENQSDPYVTYSAYEFTD